MAGGNTNNQPDVTEVLTKALDSLGDRLAQVVQPQEGKQLGQLPEGKDVDDWDASQFVDSRILDQLPAGCDTERYSYIWVPIHESEIQAEIRRRFESVPHMRVTPQNHDKIAKHEFKGGEIRISNIRLWFCSREAHRLFLERDAEAAAKRLRIMQTEEEISIGGEKLKPRHSVRTENVK